MSGCVDASKPVLTKLVSRDDFNQNLILLPGGIDEMQLTDEKSKGIYIKKIRFSLQLIMN